MVVRVGRRTLVGVGVVFAMSFVGVAVGVLVRSGMGVFVAMGVFVPVGVGMGVLMAVGRAVRMGVRVRMGMLMGVFVAVPGPVVVGMGVAVRPGFVLCPLDHREAVRSRWVSYIILAIILGLGIYVYR